jgi:sugar phosphate isomerase/epimerase
MTTINGPALFLAQFMGDEPPFNTLENIARWAAELGFIGVQIPSWDARLIDLKKARRIENILRRTFRLTPRNRHRR